MSNSDRFSKSLTAVDANNIVLLVDFNQILAPYEQFKADNIVEHTIALEDLHAKVGLFSLLEASWPNTTALASESEQEAARAKILKEGQKVYLELYTAKGNGPWELQGEEVLQNKNSLEQPWTLMPLMGTNVTALLGESLKIGVRIANKAQGVGGLKGVDYVRILGTWRKNTKIESKKKDDGIEALKAEVQALQLAIYGRLTDVPANTLLGRGSSGGIVQAIPNNFITATQSQLAIEQAIFDLAGAAPVALNTLVELAAAFNNDPNFATTITNLLATKAPLANPSFTGFTTLGDNVAIKKKLLTGTTNISQGGTTLVAHGLTGSKITSVTGVVYYSASGTVPFNSRQTNYASICATDGTNFSITNEAANSVGILSKIFYAVIEYTA